jgi:hypothetical protein
MSMARFLQATLSPTAPTSKGELVPVAAPLTLDELTVGIRREHGHAIAALADSLRSAIAAGKLLTAAKARIKAQRGHGAWEDYVTVECGLIVRTAQAYMQLAKREASLAALLSEKPQGSALSQAQALKHLGEERKKRRKRKAITSSTT